MYTEPEQNPPTIDPKALETAADIQVFNSRGGEVLSRKRLWYLSVRMQYVAQLATVREDALREACTGMALVGCGDWKLIENCKKDTEFKGETYANPDMKLYNTLGMISNSQTTPKGKEKPSYLKRGFLGTTLWSIWRRPFKSPSHRKARKDFAARWRPDFGNWHAFLSPKHT